MDLQTLRERYRDDILRLAEEYKLEHIRVFGSVVRGEADEDSDIDLLVHPIKGCSLFEFVGFQNTLGDLLKREVDLVDDQAIVPRLAPYILAEAVDL